MVLFFLQKLCVYTCVCILTENMTNRGKPKENENHLSHQQHECHSFGENRKNSESEMIQGFPASGSADANSPSTWKFTGQSLLGSQTSLLLSDSNTAAFFTRPTVITRTQECWLQSKTFCSPVIRARWNFRVHRCYPPCLYLFAQEEIGKERLVKWYAQVSQLRSETQSYNCQARAPSKWAVNDV